VNVTDGRSPAVLQVNAQKIPVASAPMRMIH